MTDKQAELELLQLLREINSMAATEGEGFTIEQWQHKMQRLQQLQNWLARDKKNRAFSTQRLQQMLNEQLN